MKNNNFIKDVSLYFQNFLETDFKKRRLPKRSIKSTDRNGDKITLNLDKYPTFKKHLINKIKNPNNFDFDIEIPRKKYTTQIPESSKKLIINRAENLPTLITIDLENEFTDRVSQIYLTNFEDIDLFKDIVINEFIDLIKVHLISNIIGDVKETISRKKQSLTEYGELELELSEAIFESIKDQVLDLCNIFFKDQDPKVFNRAFYMLKNSKIFTKVISDFFDSYSINDLIIDMDELERIKKLKDNLELYIYFGNISYQNHSFPLFFVPFEIVESYVNKKKILHLKFEKRFFINKSAIEYVFQESISKNTAPLSSVLKDRIIDLDEQESIISKCEDLMNRIASKFNAEKDFSSSFERFEKTNSSADSSFANNLFISVFEKGDESAINDYEDLIQMLDSDNQLGKDFSNVINSIITKDPINIENKVDDQWENSSISSRLVFPSPIPVNAEQRKVIESIGSKDCRYVVVEGPPGTGKSHTITALMFNAIIQKKSVLMLSDKKEALDVVESKLTETLKRVRPDDNFQNPILRIGKSGNTYAKIFNREVIDSIKTNYRSTRSALESKKFKNNLKDEVTQLKKDINKTVSNYSKIDTLKIYNQIKLAKALDVDQSNEYLYVSNISKMKSLLSTLSELNMSLDKINKDTLRFIKSETIDIKKINSNLNDDDILGIISGTLSLLENNDIQDTKKFFKSLKIEDKSSLNSFIEEYYVTKKQLFSTFFSWFYLIDWNKRINKKYKLYKQSDVDSEGYYDFRSDLGFMRIKKASQSIDKINRVYNKHIKKEKKINEYFLERALSKKVKIDEYSSSRSIIKLAESIKKFELIKKKNNIISEKPFNINLSVDYLSRKSLSTLISKLEQLVTFTKDTIDINNSFKEVSNDIRFADKLDDIHQDASLEMKQEFDKRFLDFAQNKAATARAFKKIITKKLRFPKEDFVDLKNAFPCIISGIRDYADYIPLEKDLFDLLIIDEASQVSVAQSFPAILRAKKVIVLGDRKQFGNVKSSNASNEQNGAWQANIRDSFIKNYGNNMVLLEKSKLFNIRHSILEFFEFVKNYSIFLKKHFRGYPELISFSSKYFYNGALQTIKVRSKSIEEVICFDHIEHDNLLDMAGNINVLESQHIIKKLEKYALEENPMSVGVITPFKDQQKYISAEIDKSLMRQEIIQKLNIKVMTFDSCQGEERDHIIYSMVATQARDGCTYVLGKNFNLKTMDPETNLRLQRLNVGMSRSKEKITFVISKPVKEFEGNALLILNHYQQELEIAKTIPSAQSTDSKMEEKLLHWITQTQFYQKNKENIELTTQFEIGKYLKSLDSQYKHPEYRCDFMMRFNDGDGKTKNLIIEYDGFEFHFENSGDINEFNYEYHYTEDHIEREKVLESYGFPFLRINKFILKEDPIEFISNKLENFFFPQKLESEDDNIVSVVKSKTLRSISGETKWCEKCEKELPKNDFSDPSLVSGFGRFCNKCKGITTNDYNKKRVKKRAGRAKKGNKYKSSTKKMKPCPKCSSSMTLRNGKWGKFWGCISFPYCRGTRPYG